MSIELVPFTPDDVGVLLTMTRDPALAGEFELLQDADGWNGPFTDPHNPPALRWIARVDGKPRASRSTSRCRAGTGTGR